MNKISGKKYLTLDEPKNKWYSFVIDACGWNVEFNNKNTISIEPIYGEEKLKYMAKITDGKLFIKFDNFDKKTHKGIIWSIEWV